MPGNEKMRQTKNECSSRRLSGGGEGMDFVQSLGGVPRVWNYVHYI